MRFCSSNCHCEEDRPTEGMVIRRSSSLSVKRLLRQNCFAIATQFLLALTLLSNALGQSDSTKSHILTRLASEPARNDFAILTAQIRTNTDTANAYHHLDTLLATGYGDMFWMYGCAGLYYATADQLRPSYKAKIRQAWRLRTPYRGDTENHFLMYYASLLLMSQAWPNQIDTEWFMGKSSREIYAESVEYLDHWIDETVRYGTTEWSSPRYAYYYITPLLLLAEYTKDKRLKHRFEMMLDYMLADYASDYLNGSYCGAHSRVSDEAALNPRVAEINAYGQYFFEDSVTHILPDLAFASLTSFHCPKIIRDIAHDRSNPYQQWSLKRGRQMIRYMDKWSAYDSTHDSAFHAPVYKYEYMTKDYCLGSMQGGIVQPIQQQSWSLVFNSDKPNNVITGLHPYVSADELGMFFPEYPAYQLESIGKVKKGYTSENKWVGGSPYERILQDRGILVALYDLPDSVKFPHVDIFMPVHAKELHFEKEVKTYYDTHPEMVSDRNLPEYFWKVFQYDSTLIGLRCSVPYDEIKEDSNLRIRMQGKKLQYQLFVMSQSSPEQKKHISTPTEFAIFLSSPYSHLIVEDVIATNSNGNHTLPDRSKALFYSDFLESTSGSALLTVRHGVDKLVLDFQK